MPIAIVGLSAIGPQAPDVQVFWNNILNQIDSIIDVPPSRWNIDEYYDPDPAAPDKTYCRRGGFMPDVDFNPMEFGLPPNILEVTDVSQLLSLLVARDALVDAGYYGSYDHERTGVILGVGGGQKLIAPLTTRLQYPVWERVLTRSGIPAGQTADIIEKMKLAYIPWEENSFPGMLGNVIAGRIANRLDLGGINCVVDAACASSLAALKMAMSELEEHRTDMMITGGVDTDNSIFMYMSFSKTPAFSRSNQIRPFDAESDGMMIGEAIGMMVLKRLEDAERDGDRIYAVIKGIGTSSDGRYKSIYAPRSEGQVRALRRAYADADVNPATVGLIEAHGTGTVAGDLCEVTSLTQVFTENNAAMRSVAIGSVKSQIGHTKSAAGAMGLIKAALALHQKVLPATINVTQPNPGFGLEDAPFYVNTETRPWIRAAEEAPRRAGVSSFGFGGTNYHVILEEYEREHTAAYRLNTPAQIILLADENPAALLDCLQATYQQLTDEGIAAEVFAQLAAASTGMAIPQPHARIGLVAQDAGEAAQLIATGIETLRKNLASDAWTHPKGIFYRQHGLETQGQVVALFAGQGSQHLNMGRELALNFPIVREAFGYLDGLFIEQGAAALSDAVYPPPAFHTEAKTAQAEQLQQTQIAQPAIGAISAGMYRLLQFAGFQPDFTAGHSFGELTALWAADVLDDADYFALVKARGAAMAARSEVDSGTMIAVSGGDLDALPEFEGVTAANWNSPKQRVLAGSREAVAGVQDWLQQQGYTVTPLPVSAAFHTPLVSHAQADFEQALAQADFKPAALPIYSNTTADVYPADPAAMRDLLAQHMLNPVYFQQQIENIYAAGGRIFVEFGPRNILSNLVADILGDQPHITIALNPSRQKDSDRQLREAVAHLQVLGLPLNALDPYPYARPRYEGKPGLTVKLNGANYVSEKTRAAYEAALEMPVAIKKDVMNQDQFLTVLERYIEQFNLQQTEMLRAHAQYLENQAEYVKVFFQLMQQQQALLLDNRNLPTEVLTGLNQNMALFHEQQAQTQRVHEQFLHEQRDNAHRLFDLLHTQVQGGAALATPTTSNGNGHSNGNGAAVKPAPIPAAPKPVEAPKPVLAKPTIPAAPKPVMAAPKPAVTPAAKPAVSYTPPAVTPKPAPVAAPAATLAAPKPAPVAAPAPSGTPFEVMAEAMLHIVSDKTGYPVEALELSMDIEADLGIDSIKRVEILGAMRNKFPEIPQLKPEEIAQLRTLEEISSYLHGVLAKK